MKATKLRCTQHRDKKRHNTVGELFHPIESIGSWGWRDLEKRVDLVSGRSLKPLIRSTVEQEAIYVA